MGTPDFAVPALRALIENPDYDVKLVVSQPDKPQGRKQVLTASPVKQLALQENIEVYQPGKIKEEYQKIGISRHLLNTCCSYLKEKGIDSIQYIPSSNKLEEIVDEIITLKPKVVGLSCYDANFYYVNLISKKIKEQNNNIIIITK